MPLCIGVGDVIGGEGGKGSSKAAPKPRNRISKKNCDE